MHKRIYYIVNGITLYRLVSSGFLCLLIIYNRPDLFKWLLGLSFFTDAVDGYLARMYKVTSNAGAKLDSVADDLTVVMAMIGMTVFKLDFLRKVWVFIILLLFLFIIQTALAYIRYGKMSSFHTYGAKIAAILQGSFLVLLFFLTEPFYILFYITFSITAIELIEEIIITSLSSQWVPDVKGLYWVLKKKKRPLH